MFNLLVPNAVFSTIHSIHIRPARSEWVAGLDPQNLNRCRDSNSWRSAFGVAEAMKCSATMCVRPISIDTLDGYRISLSKRPRHSSFTGYI